MFSIHLIFPDISCLPYYKSIIIIRLSTSCQVHSKKHTQEKAHDISSIVLTYLAFFSKPRASRFTSLLRFAGALGFAGAWIISSKLDYPHFAFAQKNVRGGINTTRTHINNSIKAICKSFCY